MVIIRSFYYQIILSFVALQDNNGEGKELRNVGGRLDKSLPYMAMAAAFAHSCIYYGYEFYNTVMYSYYGVMNQ